MRQIDIILPLIGKLNYTWTNTESLLIYIIAHLMKTSKEAAIVAFLSLNTTRARLDFIERLAKMAETAPDDRREILSIATRMKLEAKIRNKYNHCIYSFDAKGDLASTQLMRIAELGDDLRYGKVEGVDSAEMDRIEASIHKIALVNKSLWEFVRDHKIAA